MKIYFSIIILFVFFVETQAQKFTSYLTYEEYVEYMQQIANEHKDICRLDSIGTTYNDRLLLCLKISSRPRIEINRPKFFYSAAMHGDELTGAIMMLNLIDSLVSNPGIIGDNSTFPVIYICPFANPDGTWIDGNSTVHNAIRYNANYVDLNRNYPDIRTGKNSDGEAMQKETEAFIAYQQREKFDLSCNLHGGSEVFNYPWDSYRSAQNKHADDNWFKALGNDFVARLNDDMGTYFTNVTQSGVVEGGDWYVINGSRQDWSTYFANCREVTLEVSIPKTPSESRLNEYWYKLKDALFVFFDYCNKGFEVMVTDSLTSNPLEHVMIEIRDYDKDSSQVFTNLNGYCFRPILEGNYQVTFSKKGYQSKTLEINTTNNMTHYNIQLVPNANVDLSEIILKDTFDIYPTVVDDIVYLLCNATFLSSYATYEIIDNNGRICKKGQLTANKTQINLQNFVRGTYIIRVETQDGNSSIKRIVKK